MKQSTCYGFVWYKRQILFKSITTCLCLLLFFPLCLFSQAPTIQCDKTIGGIDYDDLYAIQKTSDGGYILGGYSSSPVSVDKTEDSKGEYDYWVVRLNAYGTKLWDKTIGGSSTDLLTCIQKTKDGGYILGGYSFSAASGLFTPVAVNKYFRR